MCKLKFDVYTIIMTYLFVVVSAFVLVGMYVFPNTGTRANSTGDR